MRLDFFKWLDVNEILFHIKWWNALSEADYQTHFSGLKNKRKYSQKIRHRIWGVLKKLHIFLSIISQLNGINLSLIPDQSLNDNDFITEMEKKLLKQTVLSTKG